MGLRHIRVGLGGGTKMGYRLGGPSLPQKIQAEIMRCSGIARRDGQRAFENGCALGCIPDTG